MYRLSAELSFITKLRVRVCSPETLDRAMRKYCCYLNVSFLIKNQVQLFFHQNIDIISRH